jgi:hypothetical protein
VENNHGEQAAGTAYEKGKPMDFDEWCRSERGEASFHYDTQSAMNCDLVIYIGPSGKDACAETGMAYAKGVPIIGLYAKGEDLGLMRRMMHEWVDNYRDLLLLVGQFEDALALSFANAPTMPMYTNEKEFDELLATVGKLYEEGKDNLNFITNLVDRGTEEDETKFLRVLRDIACIAGKKVNAISVN